MKILSLTLNTTHLRGAVVEQAQIIARFELLLSDYTPLFFSKLGLDLDQSLISFVLTDTMTLYKENSFQKTPKTSLKKVVSFYETSLFPIEHDEAVYSSEAIVIKKALHLKSSICMKQGLIKTLENLSFLGLQPDYIGAWQPCLKKALCHLLKKDLSGLFIYVQEGQGYVLQLEQTQVLFSTLLKVTTHQPSILEQALKNLPQTTPMTLIGQNCFLSSKIKELYPDIQMCELLNSSSEQLLLLGLALSAQENRLNLLSSLKIKQPVNKSSFLQKLSLINLTLSALIILTVIGLFCFHNHILKKELARLENQPQKMFVTKDCFIQKEQHLDSLSYLSKQVPEVPSPLDLIAFLSNHPVLSKNDHTSGKSAYCQELCYQLIDMATLKATLLCYFSSQELKTEFEKDLKNRCIPFKTTKQAHLHLYELQFKKGYIL